MSFDHHNTPRTETGLIMMLDTYFIGDAFETQTDSALPRHSYKWQLRTSHSLTLLNQHSLYYTAMVYNLLIR